MLNKRNIKEFLIITVGTLIVSTAVFFFMLPSHVSVGSGTALAMVLSNFIPLPVSVLTLLLNIVLLILGFILIGPEFGIKTVYCAIIMPVFLGIYEMIFPNQTSITEDPFLDVLCYIFVVGIGLIIYYLTFGIYYDDDGFLYHTFGKRGITYEYGDILGQRLYTASGNIVVELHMNDGKTVLLQATMEGPFAFLDEAFAGWCRQTEHDPENCDFHDPAQSLWFPTVEET